MDEEIYRPPTSSLDDEHPASRQGRGFTVALAALAGFSCLSALSAYSIRDVLLGLLLRNEQAAITSLLGEIHQHVDDPTIDVLQSQALHVSGKLANPL